MCAAVAVSPASKAVGTSPVPLTVERFLSMALRGSPPQGKHVVPSCRSSCTPPSLMTFGANALSLSSCSHGRFSLLVDERQGGARGVPPNGWRSPSNEKMFLKLDIVCCPDMSLHVMQSKRGQASACFSPPCVSTDADVAMLEP